MLKRIVYTVIILFSGVANSSETSIFRLISEPEAFVGKEVTVVGYLGRDNFMVLYPYEVDSELRRSSEGIIVDGIEFKIPVSQVKCINSYVKVTGQVYSIFPIVLSNIKTIKQYKKLNDQNSSYINCWTPD